MSYGGGSGRSCSVPVAPARRSAPTGEEDLDDLDVLELTRMAANAIASGAPQGDAIRTFDASTDLLRVACRDINWLGTILDLSDTDYYGEIEAHLRRGRPRRKRA